jgi:hypothetical protein
MMKNRKGRKKNKIFNSQNERVWTNDKFHEINSENYAPTPNNKPSGGSRRFYRTKNTNNAQTPSHPSSSSEPEVDNPQPFAPSSDLPPSSHPPRKQRRRRRDRGGGGANNNNSKTTASERGNANPSSPNRSPGKPSNQRTRGRGNIVLSSPPLFCHYYFPYST